VTRIIDEIGFDPRVDSGFINGGMTCGVFVIFCSGLLGEGEGEEGAEVDPNKARRISSSVKSDVIASFSVGEWVPGSRVPAAIV